MLDFPRWKVALITLPLVLLMLLAVPSFIPTSVTDKWPVTPPRINLGLDLAGGSYLLLEADVNDVAQALLERKRDQIDEAMARAPAIGTGDISLQNGQLSFLVRDGAQLDAARERLLPLLDTDSNGRRLWDLQVVDSTRVVIKPVQSGIEASVNDAMSSAVDVVRRRIDALGTREPTIVREGANRIVVQVPGLKDPTGLKELIGKTAKLEFKLVDTTIDGNSLLSGIAPIGDEIVPYPTGYRSPQSAYVSDPPAPGKPPLIAVRRQAIITGDQLTKATLAYKQDTNEPIVDFQFNSDGGARFASVTQANVNKPFAIILDNQVVSAPNIEGPILGGSGMIEGHFTPDSASKLAIELSSGKLPVALKVIEEHTVSPELGQDSINAGLLASVIAVVAVVTFMALTYGRFGLYADLAVVINVLVIAGVLALINGTLTLPGIAGFVLTIGTAVDANVLINERIREERRRGRSVIQSVELGYKEASRTIFEANVTHGIAAVIMAFLGSGPVKGFAIVLLIGIATSVFTAVLFTRMLVAFWVRRNRPTDITI